MKIALMVEGSTEKAFLPVLRNYLTPRLLGRMPKIDPVSYDGRIPKEARLKDEVCRLLGGKNPADAVIALTDVYTGSKEFVSAADAKNKMSKWVGKEPRFHPHVALHDFEAWLLPYWEAIQKLAGSNLKSPGPDPEQVNHHSPPSFRIKEAFRTGDRGKRYSKIRDGLAILRDQDLTRALSQCGELKALVNRILSLSGGQIIT